MVASRLVKSYESTLAIFFRLNIPLGIHKRIAELEGISIPAEVPTAISLAPGISISVGKPARIARVGKTEMQYQEDRFALLLNGPIEELASVLERVKEIYGKYGYDFEKTVRYYELNFPPQPIDIDGGVTCIKRGISVSFANDLSNIFGCKLEPFTISLTYPDTPLTDEWLSIALEPEVNAPYSRLLIRIVKREVSFLKMHEFLKDLPEKLNKLFNILVSGEY